MSMLVLILLAPLLAALVIFALRRAPEVLALFAAALGLLGAAGQMFAVSSGVWSTAVLPFLPDMPIRLVATPLTAILSLVVATVATFVLLYAVGYMRHDPQRVRFFGTMLLFVTAMQGLVLSGDWITLLAAWELIGFASYLLIGFWHDRPGVAAAATRAFLYTRSADLGLYIGAFLLIGVAGTSEISTTLATTGTPALIAGLLLLVAAMGKSAQVPMQDWLQRAMAGPTPVSALLHSATLVAAGAILLIRTAPMLPAGALVVIGIVGGVTAVITGLIALAEKDLKRLLAASTSSQYGLMLVAIGAGAPIAALLHLISHAAIKSSLFIGAGVFQHDRDGTGMESLAGAGRARPGIFAGFALSALALAGIPPLAGFFSKDAVIAATLASPAALWLVPLALAATVLTGAYMGRALRILWAGAAADKTEPAPLMAAGLGALVVLAAVLALSFGPLERLLGVDMAEGGLLAPVLGLSAAISGLVLGWLITPARLLGPIFGFAQRGFVMFGGMDALVARPALAIAAACERLERWLYDLVLGFGRLNLSLGWLAQKIDTKGIDRPIFGLVRRTINTGTRARKLQSGFIHREMALAVIGMAVIVAVLLAAPLYS
ncbi:MAG: NADH-quinone oxidoreductase subunit L [Amylibacter sp.]|nr:NADH-quinone oxidoreductase subunit L [Amylibacter sp.]